MEEKSKNSQDKPTFSFLDLTSSLRNKIILAVVLLSAIVAITYFINKNKGDGSRSIFTEYGPIVHDTMESKKDDELNSSTKDSSSHDTISSPLTSQDSLTVTENENADQESIVTEEKSNLFKVNTTYDKIESVTGLKNVGESLEKETIDSELFTELLLPSEDDQNLLLKVFKDQSLSYKSLLKILSITGEDILVNKSTEPSESILSAMVESDNIHEIYILDRKGEMAFKTETAEIGEQLKSMLSELHLQDKQIKILNNSEFSVISMPIYHTFGQVGMLILVVNSSYK